MWWAAVGCSWPHPAQSWLATTARRLSIFHAVHGPVQGSEASFYTVPAMRGGPGDEAIYLAVTVEMTSGWTKIGTLQVQQPNHVDEVCDFERWYNKMRLHV